MNSPQPQPDPGEAIIRLPAHGTTTTAEELRNQLVCAAELGGATVIDASAVQTIGQAVLQLLVAARRSAVAEGKPCEIIGASPALLTIASANCLGQELGLDTGKAMPQ
jgi:anti-anti-sigma regulatory factor